MKAGTENHTYAHRALDLFAQNGNHEALVGVDGRRYSYAEVRGYVIAMANVLWQHGIRPGKAIGVLARNPAESLFLQLGAHLLGCRTAWIANNAPAKFRQSFLQLSEVDAFVYDANIFPELGPELAATGTVPVFCFGPGIGPDLAAELDAAESTDLPCAPSELTTEPQSLFQTGGTTGEPKLVHHKHKFFQALHVLAEGYLASGQPQLRHLLIAGTWHVSSQTAAFLTLFTGGTLFLHDGMFEEPFLQAIETERINSTLLAPGNLYELLDDPQLAQADCNSLVTFTISGAAAAPARLSRAIERFGPVLRVVYGMSESPFITALPNLSHDPEHPERLASCGKPYADIQVEIRNSDGKVLPTGEIGEVYVQGSLIMEGYWGRPELTAETLVDGWLRTGDAGYLDADGYLFLVDRVKDMIVTGIGGTNVYCRPVEDVLAGHPQVRAAAVVGVPDEANGEAVHAFVITTPDATVTGDELRQLASSELNSLWAPREVDFVTEFPLAGSGKVDKKALRAMWVKARP